MIYMTEYDTFKDIEKSLKEGSYEVVNFSSFNETYKLLNIIPPREIRLSETPDYDKQYLEYIFNNDEHFINFMKIMKPVFDGKDVFILISSPNEVFEFMNECLQKLILERYEIPSSIINNKDDYDSLTSYEDRPYLNGVMNKDIDEKRLAKLCPNLQV